MNCFRSTLFTTLVTVAFQTTGVANIFSTDFTGALQPDGLGTIINMGGTTAPGVTVGPLSFGAGITTLRLDVQSTSPAFAAHSIGTNGGNAITTLADAITLNEYFEFNLESVTPLELKDFSFTMVQHGYAGTSGITLRSSLDSYNADLLTVTYNGPQALVPGTVDLSALSGFDSVMNVTFRFYLYDSYVGQNNRRHGIDDITITAVPEPRLAALAMGMAVAGLLIWRRRRR